MITRPFAPGRRWFRPLAVAIVCAGFPLACSALTSPPSSDLSPGTGPASAAGAASGGLPKPTDIAAAATAAARARGLIAEPDQIGASHILVAYKGANRAAPTITRSKDEARGRAEELVRKAKAGADFAALARESSDDTGSGSHGGSLGKFGRSSMVKPFADAAFALKPGEISGVVESDFGFHVIKRTE